MGAWPSVRVQGAGWVAPSTRACLPPCSHYRRTGQLAVPLATHHGVVPTLDVQPTQKTVEKPPCSYAYAYAYAYANDNDNENACARECLWRACGASVSHHMVCSVSVLFLFCFCSVS